MALRPCPECNRKVSATAPTCPGCGHAFPKKTSGCVWVFALISIALIAIYYNSDKFSSPVSSVPLTPSPPSVSIGEDCTIGYAGDSSSVIAGTTRESFDEAIKLSRAKDTMGLVKMEMRRLIFTIPAGTRAKLIEKDTFVRRVRITQASSKNFGDDGWVTMESVQPAP